MALILLLWVSLLLGQLGAMSLGNGVRIYLHDITLTVIILVAIFRRGLLSKLHNFFLTRPIALFSVLGAVALIANISSFPPWIIGKGSLYLFRWIAYAFFYGAILVSPLSAQFWLWWLASYGTALAAVGLMQFVWYPDLRNLWYLGWDPHYYRVFATLLDPNYTGILLVLTLFVLAFLFVRSLRFRLWIALASGMVGLALLLTYSRSSYLALIAGMGTAIITIRRWKEGMILVLLVFLSVVWMPRPGGDTLSLDRYDSSVSRLQNWEQTIGRIGLRPITGYGFQTTQRDVDSSLLSVGLSSGILGLAGYLWLISRQIKLAQKSNDIVFKALYFSSFTAVLTHSFFVNSLFYPWVMLWVWILVGAAEKIILNR